MPIKEDFCKGDKKPIGKINYNDGENFHWVWPSQAGESGNDWDASKDAKKPGKCSLLNFGASMASWMDIPISTTFEYHPGRN